MATNSTIEQILNGFGIDDQGAREYLAEVRIQSPIEESKESMERAKGSATEVTRYREAFQLISTKEGHQEYQKWQKVSNKLQERKLFLRLLREECVPETKLQRFEEEKERLEEQLADFVNVDLYQLAEQLEQAKSLNIGYSPLFITALTSCLEMVDSTNMLKLELNGGACTTTSRKDNLIYISKLRPYKETAEAAELGHRLATYFRGDEIDKVVHELYDVAATHTTDHPYDRESLAENAKLGRLWLKKGDEGVTAIKTTVKPEMIKDFHEYRDEVGVPAHQVAAYLFEELSQTRGVDNTLKLLGNALANPAINTSSWKEFYAAIR